MQISSANSSFVTLLGSFSYHSCLFKEHQIPQLSEKLVQLIRHMVQLLKTLESAGCNIIYLRKILNCQIIFLIDIMAFRKVGAVILLVTNIDNSTKFYRDTLGLVVKNATNEWTEFFTSGTVLALHPAKTRVKPSPSMLVGFMVSDLESIVCFTQGKKC